jgi:hypothetical protein
VNGEVYGFGEAGHESCSYAKAKAANNRTVGKVATNCLRYIFARVDFTIAFFLNKCIETQS